MAARRGYYVTRTLLPPAERITPAIAARWMRTTYPRLAGFSALGFYSDILRPPRHREEIRVALASLALDARRIAQACVEALATGRPVAIRLEYHFKAHRGMAPSLRRALEFEQRHPHRLRGILQAALHQLEREIRAQRREAA